MNKHILGLAVTAFFSTSVVQAASVTYSEQNSFGTQGSATDVSMGVLNQKVSLTGFNAALGTLTGVNVTVFGQLDSAGFSRNFSDALGSASVAISLTQDWVVSSASAAAYTFLTADLTTPILSASSGPGFSIPINGGQFDYALTSGQLSSTLGSVVLNDYLAANVDFFFAGIASTSINNTVANGTGSFLNSFSTGSWGKVVVDYTYDDATPPVNVPEPTSIALLGMGLAAFGFVRRKKSA